jgi:hypothetical protein
MMMYIASHTRHGIAYDVYQSSRLTVKRIMWYRYWKGTSDKRIIFKPNKSNKIDCHVDSDFDGLFGVEDGLTPICAKSCSGYVIKLDLGPVREVLKKIMLVVFEKSFKPECTTHSKAFQDGTPSKD